MRVLDYVALQRPDNNFATGTVVAVKSTNSFNGEIVCNADLVFEHVTLPLKSDSVAANWQSSTNASLSVGANVTSAIDLKLGGAIVSSINASLTNPVIYDLRDTDILWAGQEPQTPICLKAIRARLDAKVPVIIIRSSIGANASYTIKYNDSVTAQAQAQIAPTIAPQVAAGLTASGQSTLSGTGLVFGVQPTTKGLLEYVDVSTRTPALSVTADKINVSLQLQTGSAGLNIDPTIVAP